jgi:glucokinase
VFDRAAAGEPVFVQILDRYTTYLAVGLANLINIFGPAYICIGGGVSHAGDALLQPVREKTYQRMYAKAAARKPQIILAKLHNDAGILGAALLDD